MSSLAAGPSPERAYARGPGGARTGVPRWLTAHPGPPVTIALAAMIVAAAFVGRGSSGEQALGRTTPVEIGLTLLGTAAVAAAAVAAPASRRLWGGVTALLMAAVTAEVAVSVSWSIVPDASWNEANLTLAYFAAFAGAAALVRLAPARWRSLLGAIVIASLVVSVYALWRKVFPSPSPADAFARTQEPFDYWNATGLMAALGVPAVLWLGARRDGHAALRAVAVPALGLLLCTVLLSYGRGALLATILAGLLWFVIVPLRLRGVAVVAVAGAATAGVCAWAFSVPALTIDFNQPGRAAQTAAVRADAGHHLGLLLLVMVIVLLLAGLALSFAMSRSTLTGVRRRHVGTVVLVLVALVPLAGITKLAVSQRGLGGSISHAWTQLTDPNATQPGNDPSRFGQVGSARARYWDDALKLWREQRFTGLGADAYSTAATRVQTTHQRVSHAHGYVFQTLADLGWLGLGLNLALALAWLLATGRALGARAAAPALAAERIGLTTLAITAVTFAFHSAIDWTWYIPSLGLIGCLAAGWVAARGPLAEPPAPARLPHPLHRTNPVRLALAATVIVAGIGSAWMIWQPLHASDKTGDAYALAGDGHYARARAAAKDAIATNPLSILPLQALATVEEDAGQLPAARAALERSVRLQPANYRTWFTLGTFELRQGNVAQAVAALNAATYLAPQSPIVQSYYAHAVQRAGTGP